MDFSGITGEQPQGRFIAYGVQSNEISDVWPAILPLLLKPFGRTIVGMMYDLADIYRALKEKKMQLWVLGTEARPLTAVAITQIIEYPRCKVLDVILFGGDNAEAYFEHCIETARIFAKAENCKFVGMYGRIGWARKYRAQGGDPSLWMMIPVGDDNESH